MAKAQASSVFHVLRITRWNFDYSFGLNTLKGENDLYSDFRHLELHVGVLKPTGIKAKQGRLVFFPDENFAAGSPTRTKKFADHFDKSPVRPPPPVGHVSYRGKDYKANLFMPPDALPLVLTMLSAEKYRFVSFEAENGSRDAPISSFYFSESVENGSEQLAGWDDV
jgi:hypothetical protein